jgi:hypothetical protein
MASMSDEPRDLQKQHEVMKNILIVGAVAIAAVIIIFIMISIFSGGSGVTQTGPCG